MMTIQAQYTWPFFIGWISRHIFAPVVFVLRVVLVGKSILFSSSWFLKCCAELCSPFLFWTEIKKIKQQLPHHSFITLIVLLTTLSSTPHHNQIHLISFSSESNGANNNNNNNKWSSKYNNNLHNKQHNNNNNNKSKTLFPIRVLYEWCHPIGSTDEQVDDIDRNTSSSSTTVDNIDVIDEIVVREIPVGNVLETILSSHQSKNNNIIKWKWW